MKPFFIPLFLFCCNFMAAQEDFHYKLSTDSLPWTDRAFDNAKEQFQFAVVSDRTGGHRAGVFGDAMQKLNLLHPEFVMSVGDLIEGYTKDTAILNSQWSEFDSILSSLNMRFFALPGNHDISNDVMRDRWLSRYGASYYHFRYKDVLFLAFDSNDGDGVMFSRDQLDYFKQVIAEEEDVRWTLIFMHHPIWNYRAFNGFDEIEAALKDRPYTVFAGHTHRYFKSQRNGRNYYVLSTTGGGSKLRSPRVGEFDHITWVTMTPEGPEIVHLQLSGIIDEDVLNEQTAPIALALHNATQIEQMMLQKSASEGVVYLRIANTLDGGATEESSGLFYRGEDSGSGAVQNQTLRFEGRFYHNHHITPEQDGLSLLIPPDSIVQIAIPVRIGAAASLNDIDPLELDWTLGFESDQPFTPAFELSGILDIRPENVPTLLSFTPMDVFLERHEVKITSPFENLEIRYTVDGSEPAADSPLYTTPIEIQSTTTIKACYFDSKGESRSRVTEREYRKVVPEPSVKIKRSNLAAGLRYAYYEGDFTEKLPDFDQLKPTRSGIALHSHPDSLEHRMDHFAFSFDGYIEVPTDGIYTFYTRSDDGSQLFIQDKLVVDNNGSHSAQVRFGNIALRKGLHPIRVTYFEDFLGETLEIGYEGDGIDRRKVPFSELFHKK
ncbi:PA14 domain-containing protein [Phaeodactylibacter sp.]|uniref:PA14 domain-containing protein n=1 Tax=Phaeodactylibacter sp. TaxID=1940289 RepID=UPI0025DEE49D|nr:PA14 domain-containing protein [Phaeodactylibacter sp.]MCI4648162.1 chitobiase/beta-hexosaminidase C-terminal domain-containing protein [Phaeodactylibacter sp.]MCI5091057.1 chitobiase/beta-hexosaminidase C-terminal domain-containing protein [Phaeodactylibacter sp.]